MIYRLESFLRIVFQARSFHQFKWSGRLIEQYCALWRPIDLAGLLEQAMEDPLVGPPMQPDLQSGPCGSLVFKHRTRMQKTIKLELHRRHLDSPR
ncbi:MAG: hypothetical protein KDK39_18690 [Leptospiraceae bacterium]|nr:hypothetical protein [Leptospiraceae bacterium]